MAAKKNTDWFMFSIASGLGVFGAMMVYSASAMMALKESNENSQFGYFFKQIAFVGIGIVAMFVVSRIDYHIFQNPWVVFGILTVTVVALGAVFGFAPVNGAQRWIRISGWSFQPSELAKIAVPVFLAWFLTRNEGKVSELRATVLPCLFCLGVLAALVMAEKDLGTTMVLCAIFSTVYFAAGARIMHIAAVGASMAVIGIAAIVIAPWRVQRIMAFLDPYKYSDDSSYQVIQSLYAIGSGGIFGQGFSRGQQKLFYLPYPYSDFIFSVVGEEFGLIGTIAVVFTFGLLLWRGTRAAINAPDRFGMLLGIGLITGIIAQALFNISVVTSILPAKGIPLPFISYGGTSVVATLVGVGILVSISRFSGTAERPQREPGPDVYDRPARRA
jgi:cell division protein FtsW